MVMIHELFLYEKLLTYSYLDIVTVSIKLESKTSLCNIHATN